MNSQILIKNGNIITSEKSFKSDILIKNEKIVEIKEHIKADNENLKVIDADKSFVFSGAVDAHVHFALPTPAGPSSDDFYTGSIAAIAGGTTSIIDFVTPSKGESFLKAIKERKEEAESSLIDYGLHLGVTWWGEQSEYEIEKAIKEEGINSFKTYLAYKNSVGIDDYALASLMDCVSKLKGLVTVHCENSEIINLLQSKLLSEGKASPKYHQLAHPAEIETEAVNKAVIFAKLLKCPLYIVHISAEESVEIIKNAQKRGQVVFGETCPQYLLLDNSVYNSDGFEQAKYVINPPLRNKINQKYLWKGIENGAIQVVSTDHCPFFLKGQKDKGKNDFTKIPNGAGGIEERLNLLFTYGVLKNRISINQFVNIVSTNPAKIFGIYPQKGEIAVGSDADIVVWNPEIEKKISAKTHKQNCDTNIYEGFKVKGNADYVIVRGKIAVEQNKFDISGLKGNYLFRQKLEY